MRSVQLRQAHMNQFSEEIQQADCATTRYGKRCLHSAPGLSYEAQSNSEINVVLFLGHSVAPNSLLPGYLPNVT